MLLWAHFVSSYLFVVVAFYYLRQGCITYQHYRLRFLQSQSTQKTILVEYLPPGMTSEQLAAKFSDIYQDVVSAYVAQDLTVLKAALVEREASLTQLERAEVKFAANQRKHKAVTEIRPKHRIGGLIWCGGQLVDALQHYQELVAQHTHKVACHDPLIFLYVSLLQPPLCPFF